MCPSMFSKRGLLGSPEARALPRLEERGSAQPFYFIRPEKRSGRCRGGIAPVRLARSDNGTGTFQSGEMREKRQEVAQVCCVHSVAQLKAGVVAFDTEMRRAQRGMPFCHHVEKVNGGGRADFERGFTI